MCLGTNAFLNKATGRPATRGVTFRRDRFRSDLPFVRPQSSLLLGFGLRRRNSVGVLATIGRSVRQGLQRKVARSSTQEPPRGTGEVGLVGEPGC
jgi:hypothetical protein